MGYIQVALDEAQETQPVEEGQYPLVIAYVEEKESKAGSPMIVVGHEIEGEPNADMVYHYIVLPTEEDEPKTRNFKLLNLKRYLTLAGIPFDDSGFDTDELLGTQFEGYLAKEEIEQEDPEAPPAFRNVLKVPRISSES